jgi:hypothetical protein
MNFTKYTTQELEFIISNFDDLKRELETRHVEELDDFPNFTFEVGDIIHSKYNNDNLLLKIKEIDIINNSVVADLIIIRDRGLFGAYVDEWYDIDNTDWSEYIKIEDSALFENLLKIMDKYNDDVQQLNDDTYLKLKNEIAPYDF